MNCLYIYIYIYIDLYITSGYENLFIYFILSGYIILFGITSSYTV